MRFHNFRLLSKAYFAQLRNLQPQIPCRLIARPPLSAIQAVLYAPNSVKKIIGRRVLGTSAVIRRLVGHVIGGLMPIPAPRAPGISLSHILTSLADQARTYAMSGLEGFAALGLACNVLQLIGSVATSITVAKNILDTGTIDPALAERNGELTKLYEDIRDSLGKVRRDDKELRDVAGKILQTTAELRTELAEIAGSSSKGKTWMVFGGIFKTMLKRRKLEALEKQASSYQKMFETRLLLRLRYDQTPVSLCHGMDIADNIPEVNLTSLRCNSRTISHDSRAP